MIKFLLLIHLFSFGSETNIGDPQQIISCHYTNTPFVEFCKDIENKTNTTIFYKKTWVENIMVTIDIDSITVENAIQLALKSTSLKVNIWNNSIILSEEHELISNLPNYQTQETKSTINYEKNNYLQTKSANNRVEIIIGKKDNKLIKQKQRVRAKITDKSTGEILIGATIYIEELRTGTASSINGILELYLYPGKYTAKFNFLGYKKRIYQITVNSNGSFNVQMEKSGIELSEIAIYGDKLMNKTPGVERIRAKVVKQIPMMMGEVDVLKISEMLPGIVSVGEGSAGVNVRGGSSDQNAFYINKIPVFNTSHLFGFSSAFNPDIIKDFSIYKGYIPLQYGGRLASVFDIDTRHGNKQNFTAHGGISPLSANLVVETPIVKDKASVILSGRSSYSDWILGRVKDITISNSSANFYDFSAEFNLDLSKTQFAIFFYRSNDFFALSDIAQYQYSTDGLSLSLNHNFTEKIRGTFSIASSLYKFNTIDNSEISGAYEQDYYINQSTFTSEFQHALTQKHNLSYGLNFNYYVLNRGTVSPYGDESIRQTLDLGIERGEENAIYFSDKYSPLPWLDVTFGIRYSLYAPLGDKTAYIYRENKEKIEENIIDSISFGPYQAINWNSFPEIRAAISIETDRNGTIKLAFNQMHQNLFMLSTTIAIAPNSQWKLADYHLKPSSNNQFSLGIFRNMPSLKLEGSAEIYFSYSENYTEFKDGADFLNTPLVETAVLQGNQHAYGLEIMLKKQGKYLDGWMAYTYSRSLIEINGINDWDKINNGDIYPANHDIPHSFNAVVNYKIKKRLSVSSVITYQKGKPATFPTSTYFVDNKSYIDYSARNSYRIPDYFRIDLSMSIEGNLKKNKFIHSSWQLGIYNLTGRDNAYSVYFKSRNNLIKSYQYSIISVPIFTATWVFKLGNYESI